MSYPSNSGVAHDQLRAFVERIERMDEELKTINDDKREIYAEAKGNGFDVKALKRVVQLRRQDRADRLEFETIVEIYMASLEGRPIDDDDDEPSRVQAHAREDTSSQPSPNAGISPAGVMDPAEFDRRSGDEAGQPIADTREGAPAGAAVAGQSDAQSSAAAEGNDAETAAPATNVTAFRVPEAKPLRPYCLKPQLCAGQGRQHCFTCQKAHAESEGLSA